MPLMSGPPLQAPLQIVLFSVMPYSFWECGTKQWFICLSSFSPCLYLLNFSPLHWPNESQVPGKRGSCDCSSLLEVDFRMIIIFFFLNLWGFFFFTHPKPRETFMMLIYFFSSVFCYSLWGRYSGHFSHYQCPDNERFSCFFSTENPYILEQ